MSGLRTLPTSWTETYFLTSTLPVPGSISTAARSQMKPKVTAEATRSRSSGGPSPGGDRMAVSKMPGAMPSGRPAGCQWVLAATRRNGRDFSGTPTTRAAPPASSTSSAATSRSSAATARTLSATRRAASPMASTTTEENRFA